MVQARVAITRCGSYETSKIAEKLRENLALVGGLKKFVEPGQTVLLKPNFIAPKPVEQATQTHPMVIIEMARQLREIGAKPFVGDSPAWGNVYKCADFLDLSKPLKKMRVPLVQLDNPRKVEISEGKTVGISSHVLEADKIINMPKFKTHQQMTATFAVKNMFGCVSGKSKALWHFRRGQSHQRFAEFLIEIYQHIGPCLNIIDGVVAMDGQGPINGRTRRLGYIISGVDPIACERVCCDIGGFEPKQLPVLQAAEEAGFGCQDISEIEILGEGFPESPVEDFMHAELTPLRFSLGHVIRSMVKQGWMLMRDRLTIRG